MKRRQKGRSRAQEYHADEQDDPAVDIREIMLHLLRCMACPDCLGTGRMIDGQLPEGGPRFAFCKCRVTAVQFLEEFQ